jgi:hypothetical protein
VHCSIIGELDTTAISLPNFFLYGITFLVSSPPSLLSFLILGVAKTKDPGAGAFGIGDTSSLNEPARTATRGNPNFRMGALGTPQRRLCPHLLSLGEKQPAKTCAVPIFLEARTLKVTLFSYNLLVSSLTNQALQGWLEVCTSAWVGGWSRTGASYVTPHLGQGAWVSPGRSDWP